MGRIIISTVDINNDKGKLVKKTETSRGQTVKGSRRLLWKQK